MAGAHDPGAGCDTGRPLCGKPARFYPAGWRCDEHRPTAYRYAAPPTATQRGVPLVSGVAGQPQATTLSK